MICEKPGYSCVLVFIVSLTPCSLLKQKNVRQYLIQLTVRITRTCPERYGWLSYTFVEDFLP